MSKGRKWTIDEIQFLIKQKGSMSYSEISSVLNRSIGSVRGKVDGLKITNKSAAWTDWELNYLIENYGSIPNKIIGELFNRTSGNIKTQGRKMGLCKDVWWSDAEIQIVKDNYSNNYFKIHDMLPNRTHKAIEKQAYIMGLTINKKTYFQICNNNLKGRLTCKTTENPNFKNEKGLRYACRNRIAPWVRDIKDKYKVCVITGSSENLVVHHIISFKHIFDTTLHEYEKAGFIKDDNLEKCFLLNGENFVLSFIKEVFNRHEINDGILITTEIHDRFHNIYGTKNCTKENFEEFLLNECDINMKEVILNGYKKENNNKG